MRRTEAMKIITRVLKQPVEGVPAADLIYGRALAHIEDPTPEGPKPWAMQVDMLALRIAAQLPLTDDTEQKSPLARAEDAKRNRDLAGEVGVLMSAGADLESAPWHPVRPGDLVHVHYDAGGLSGPFGETYIIAAGEGGFLSMQLLAHTVPEAENTAGLVGCFAVEDDPDPLMELWFEVGPQRLTIVRDGRAVHDGAAPRPRPGAGAMLKAFGLCIGEAERYLERGDAAAALARLRSAASLPPCGAPGVMPEHADCARWKGHGGVHSPDADYTEPPHECPTLPEQLHAVVTVGAKVEDVHLAGLYEDQEAAADHAMGFHAFRAELDRLTERFVKPAPGAPGEMVLELPAENEIQATGVQLAVVVPLQILPDPRAEDEQEDYDYGDPGDDYDDWGDE